MAKNNKKNPERSKSKVKSGSNAKTDKKPLLDLQGNPIDRNIDYQDEAYSGSKDEEVKKNPNINYSDFSTDNYKLKIPEIQNPQDNVKTPEQDINSYKADLDEDLKRRKDLYLEYVNELKSKNLEPHYNEEEFTNLILQGKDVLPEGLQNIKDEEKINELYGKPGSWERFKSYATGRLSISPTTTAIKNATLGPLITKGIEATGKIIDNTISGKDTFHLSDKEKEYYESNNIQYNPKNFTEKYLIPGISSGLLTVTSLGGLNTVLTQNFPKLVSNPALLNALSMTIINTPEYTERFSKGDNIESILKDASLNFSTGALLGSNPFKRFLPREIYGAIIPTVPNETIKQLEGKSNTTELISELTTNAILTFLNASGYKPEGDITLGEIAEKIQKNELNDLPAEVKNNSVIKQLTESISDWITSPHRITGSKNLPFQTGSLNSGIGGPENNNIRKSLKWKHPNPEGIKGDTQKERIIYYDEDANLKDIINSHDYKNYVKDPAYHLLINSGNSVELNSNPRILLERIKNKLFSALNTANTGDLQEAVYKIDEYKNDILKSGDLLVTGKDITLKDELLKYENAVKNLLRANLQDNKSVQFSTKAIQYAKGNSTDSSIKVPEEDSLKFYLQEKNNIWNRISEITDEIKQGNESVELLKEQNKLIKQYDEVNNKIQARRDNVKKQGDYNKEIDYLKDDINEDNFDDFAKYEYELFSKLDEILYNKKNNIKSEINDSEAILKDKWNAVKSKMDEFVKAKNIKFDENKVYRDKDTPVIEEEIRGKFVDSNELSYPNPRRRAVRILEDAGYTKHFINSLDQYELLDKASQHEKDYSKKIVDKYNSNKERIAQLEAIKENNKLTNLETEELNNLIKYNSKINIEYENKVLGEQEQTPGNENPLIKIAKSKKYTDYEDFTRQLTNEEFTAIDDYLTTNKVDKPIDEFLENNSFLINKYAEKKTNITEEVINDLKENSVNESDNEAVNEAVSKLNSANAKDTIKNIDEKVSNGDINITKNISLKPEPEINKEKRTFSQFLSDAYSLLFDKFHPLKKIEQQLLKENIQIPDVAKPYLRARLYPAILDKIESWIFRKAVDYDKNGNVIELGKGLEEILTQDKLENVFKGREAILSKITDNPDMTPQDLLSVYMTNRAVLERTLQGQEHTISLNEAIANVHVIDKYFPEIREVYETDIKQFNNNLLNMAKDYLGDNKIALLSIYRQDYASLERSFDDFEKTGKFNINVKNFVDSRQPVKKSKGNDNLVYKNALENMIKNTFMILDRIERNTIGKNVVKAMEKSEVLKGRIKEINPLKTIKTDTDLFGNEETFSEADYYQKQLDLANRVNNQIKNNPVKPVLPKETIDNLTGNLFGEDNAKTEQLDLFGKAKSDVIQAHNISVKETVKELDNVLEEYYQDLQNVYKDINTFKRNDPLKYSDHIERLESIAEDIKNQMSTIRDNKYNLLRSKPDTNEIDMKIHETIDFIKNEKEALIDIDTIKNKLYEAQEYERNRHTSSLKNIPHITFFDNGVKRTFRVPQDIYESMQGLNDAHTELLTKALSIPTKLIQKGSTLTPEFTIPNFIRDQWTAFVNTGATPFVNYFRGLGHYLKRDELFNKWLNSGARGTNFFTVDRDSLQDILNKMKEDSYRNAVTEFSDPHYLLHLLQDSPATLLKNPFKSTKGILEAIGNIGEVPTRIGLFELGKKRGMSDMEASFFSREGTVDFQRSGNIMNYTGKDDPAVKRIPLTTIKALYSLIPFMNARTQGLDRTIREFKTNPMSAIIRTMPLVTGTLFFKYLNDQDEYYKSRPQWEKDMYWHLPRVFSKPILKVITPALYKAGVKSALLAEDEFIKIPKGDIGYLFGSILEKAISGEDTFDILYQSAKILSPFGDPEQGALIPTFIKPVLENEITNQKSFSKENISILTKDEQGMLPGTDVKYNTAETFERIGKLLNNRYFTPVKLQNYYQNFTGSMGNNMLNAFEGVLRYLDIYDKDKAPINELGDEFIVRRFITKRDIYTDDLRKFYELHNKAKTIYNTYNSLKSKNDFQAADDFLNTGNNNEYYQLYFETKAVNQKIIEFNKERENINKKYTELEDKLKVKIDINKYINEAIKGIKIKPDDLMRKLIKEEADDSGFYYNPTQEELTKGYIDDNKLKDDIIRQKEAVKDNYNIDDTEKNKRLQKLDRMLEKLKDIKPKEEDNTILEKRNDIEKKGDKYYFK